MSHEIVWTAAAQTHGAKSEGRGGRGTGYGNVCLSRGMPPNLTRLLENLQAYRELSEVPGEEGKPRAAPVDLFHFVGRYGGQSLNIVGRRARTASASGRSNNIVHLVAFLPTDFDQLSQKEGAGPAAEVRSISWETNWAYDRPPTFREDDDQIRPKSRAETVIHPCHRWKTQLGDAGWAGVLADAGIKRRPVVLIVPRSADASALVLDLYAEALQLLPPEDRWQISFCTYWMGDLPGGIQCLWRAVYVGSPDVGALKRLPDAIVIDLQQKESVKPQDESRRVALARTGGAAYWIEHPKTDDAFVAGASSDYPADSGLKSRAAGDKNSEETYRLGATPVRYRQSASEQPGKSEPRTRESILKPLAFLFGWKFLLPAGMSLVLLIGSVIAFWPPSKRQAGDRKRGASRSRLNEYSSNDSSVNNASRVEDDDMTLTEAGARRESTRMLFEVKLDNPSLEPVAPPSPPPGFVPAIPKTQPTSTRRIFDEIRARGYRLPIPPKKMATGLQPVVPEPVRLIKLKSVKNADNLTLDLDLLGVGTWYGNNAVIEVNSKIDGDANLLIVTKKPTKGIGLPVELGRFIFQNSELSFKPAATNVSQKELEFCWLRMRCEGDEVVAALREAQVLESGLREFLSSFAVLGKDIKKSIDLSYIPVDALRANPQNLFVSFVPVSTLKSYWKSDAKSIWPGEPTDFEFRVDDNPKSAKVFVKMTLVKWKESDKAILELERFGLFNDIGPFPDMNPLINVRTSNFESPRLGELVKEKIAKQDIKNKLPSNERLTIADRNQKLHEIDEYIKKIDAAIGMLHANRNLAGKFNEAAEKIFKGSRCEIRLQWKDRDFSAVSITPENLEAVSILARTTSDEEKGKR